MAQTPLTSTFPHLDILRQTDSQAVCDLGLISKSLKRLKQATEQQLAKLTVVLSEEETDKLAVDVTKCLKKLVPTNKQNMLAEQQAAERVEQWKAAEPLRRSRTEVEIKWQVGTSNSRLSLCGAKKPTPIAEQLEVILARLPRPSELVLQCDGVYNGAIPRSQKQRYLTLGERSEFGGTFGNHRRKFLVMCQLIMKPYGIPMYELSTSWENGQALCAFIHAFRPELIDTQYFKCKDAEKTLNYALSVAKYLGVEFPGDLGKLLQEKEDILISMFSFLDRLYYVLKTTRLQ
ncbi:maker91 [Drosophila busckii]|uniref:Maker91 n=1 Tax=Drosophila busckii TaxID=30019 RepID=A0A0M5JAH0_DROBS|nr:cytospin-A [Drosophila busckii]ALC41994.1 maker91 [Drosophila busckii]